VQPTSALTTPTATPTPKARVPAVKGLSLTKAKRKLRAAGLDVGDIHRRPSSKRKDTVLKQGVDKGTKLESGSSVDLVVAAPLPQVPKVVGRSEASAIRRLKNAGFNVKKTTQTRYAGRDEMVLSQSPPGGTRAKPTSVVRIVILNVQRRPEPDSTRNCTPGYSPCLPHAFDYDCRGNGGNGPKYVDEPVRVTGSDPYDLDRNGDGVGCEE
jgi:beta-lactam-binding protein with PASTA domain